MAERLPSIKYRERPPFEAKRLFSDDFVSRENAVLEEAIPSRRGAEIEARKKIPASRRWRKALLSAVTLMATLGPAFPQEARAEGSGDEGPAYAMRAENNKLQIRSGDNYHSVDAPETDPGKIALNTQKAVMLRTMVESKEVGDAVAYLRSVYGPAMTNFLGEIEMEEKILIMEKDARDEGEKNVVDILAAGEYDFFWDKEEILERNEANTKNPRVDGFENTPAFSNEKMKGLLSGLPRNLVSHVDEVRYVDAKSSRTNYDVAGTAETLGLQGAFWKEKGNVVTFYDEPALHGENANEEVRSVIYHEVLGHENDWESSDRLTMLERLEMLMDVTRRLEDPGRSRSDYIDGKIPEEYKMNNWDVQEMKYRQARELWAIAVENDRDLLAHGSSKAGMIFAGYQAPRPKVRKALPEDGVPDAYSPPSAAGMDRPVPIEYELVHKWLTKIESGK